MSIIYNLIFTFIIVIYFPIYLCRRKFHQGFLLRLGILPKNLELGRPIWLHAVSVGEAMVAKNLLEELRIIYPDKKFVLSTVTTTGNKIARTIAQNSDFVTYLPLDFSFIVRSVIDRINPSLFILVETEYWPNLISYLYQKNIPIAVVNGRVSDQSFRGYALIKIFLKSILKKIDLFCVQTSRDAERLIRLGAPKNRVQVTGNMKFDLKEQVLSFDVSGLQLKEEEQLLVCGSTHPGEEEIILNVYDKLLKEFPNLRLLIAPRHPERSEEIERITIRYGFNPLRITQLNASPGHQVTRSPVFILDTIGQLLSFYSIADIVFVGGSLTKTGGHNILEPAALSKPILFGPQMFNFRDIADLFLKEKAALLIRNQKEFAEKIRYLLQNPSPASLLGQRAKELIQRNQGATLRSAELIKTLQKRIIA
ncbi:MAG: 3-deoxy-D-manno-octulosonic acid transferase [Candidatus Omnitrophica bacterium]|nr:3-deoxy-D-manno-octulosonic acid transferase [Candidatus Omnitrophota bacterium]